MNTRDIQRMNCLNKVSILTKSYICHSVQDINLCSVNATVTSALSGHPSLGNGQLTARYRLTVNFREF